MKHISIVSFLLFISLAVMSQTLQECIVMARDNYPEIKRHDLILQCRDYNVSNVMRGWLPQVSVTARASWQNEVSEQQKINVDRKLFLFNSKLKTIAESEEITRIEKMLDSDDTILQLRTKVRIANEAKYNNGVVDINNLTRAITDETQAALARTAHEIQLLQAQYKLKRTWNHE